jgi:hypothetical protein
METILLSICLEHGKIIEEIVDLRKEKKGVKLSAGFYSSIFYAFKKPHGLLSSVTASAAMQREKRRSHPATLIPFEREFRIGK